MSSAIDMNAVLRDAVALALAEHIKARLIQEGCVLLTGSPEGHAKFIVRKWGDASVRAFYILAQSRDRFWSYAQIAKETGTSAKSVESFWQRTLQKKTAVSARFHDTVETRRVALFRKRHEMFWSAFGIKLQIKASMLTFGVARTITDTTRAQTAAFRLNYEGACEAQEADMTKSAEDRGRARSQLDSDLAPTKVEKKQGDLFGEAKSS